MNGRIDKQFIAFEPGKEQINSNYSKLQVLNMASINATALFLNKYISSILSIDLDEYKKRENAEPLVLIIGTRTYLNIFRSKLTDLADYMEPSQGIIDKNTMICEAYRILLVEENANIGWRLLLYHDPIDPPREQKKILKDSIGNVPLVDLIPTEYQQKHRTIIDLIRLLIGSTGSEKKSTEQSLENTVGSSFKEQIVKYFSTEQSQDQSADSESFFPIQMVTYQGSKGLAADYVFLLGVNNEDIPKDPANIEDYEICEFIVGLTRTKKECYVLPIRNVFG